MKISDSEYTILEGRVKRLLDADIVRVFIKIWEHGENQTFWEADAKVLPVHIHKIQPLDDCTSLIKTQDDVPLVSAHELSFADVIAGDYVTGNKTIRAFNYQMVNLE